MSSDKIQVTFEDGRQSILPRGISVSGALESAAGSGNGWIAARVNGKLVDLATTLEEDATIEGLTADSGVGLEILRHSASHIMAQAVKGLFPEAKVAIGPAIENGFYYDFDVDRPFTEEDLARIEAGIAKIVSQRLAFHRREMAREEAIKFFEQRGETYKVELLRELSEPNVSLYEQGGFVDLCRGPHLPHTGHLKALGDERNKMLQRIYGTGFATQELLDEHLRILEEARKRDHRRLGKELDLFQVNEEAGAGLAIFHPKGMLLRWIIEDWERKEHLKRGYDMVMGPQILKVDLWKRSGHYEHYRENMYFTEVEGQAYGIKPMNCLAHMLIYKSKIRSYRDLPLRYFELGTVHRHEKTGVLHGLMRARQFTQDDAHILCMPEQLNAEIRAIADFVAYAMKIFGFEYEVELSTRPSKSIGSDEDWELATSALEGALRDGKMRYDINEGDGAFYGPKIDFKLKDALKRKWQCATIQCDFTLPERFDLSYIGPDGEKHRPVMLHRVILGAIERFMGVLIEHYAGAFPVWLSPVQAVLLSVTDKHIPYGETVHRQLVEAGIRAEKGFENEKLGFKIRQAQMQKIPYMLVIGDREMEAGQVSPRQRDGRNLGSIGVEDFVARVREQCDRYQ